MKKTNLYREIRTLQGTNNYLERLKATMPQDEHASINGSIIKNLAQIDTLEAAIRSIDNGLVDKVTAGVK